MIYIYDGKGKVTAEYPDWKRRDVELDMHNGSLTGKILKADNKNHYIFEKGEYREKTIEEKFSEGLITSKDKEDADLAKAAAAHEVAIQAELRKMAEERLELKS